MTDDIGRVAPSFRDVLGTKRLADADHSPHVIFGLWPDLSLAYLNPAWFRFARENGGEPVISREWVLGRRIMEAVAPSLQVFYHDLFRAQLGAEVLELRQFQYECSSADVCRQHLMSIYRLGEGDGLLVTNVCVAARPHDRRASQPYLDDYHDQNGWVRQCSHCRCVQRRDVPERWDWIPYWVAAPPANTTHGLCPTCVDHFYPA